jgi:uncharacterized small protein (DUF1192 family)
MLMEGREESMIQIFEDDVLNVGKKQVVISNDALKVIIVPEVGGRIADIQSGESRFLYKTYPKGVSFGPYTEYGGIEECIGGAPGSMWNASWIWDEKDDGVLLQIQSRTILVRKFITVHESEPIIKIKYDFSNTGNTFSRFTFGIHPEICIDGNLKGNTYHIPSEQGSVDGGYSGAGFKKSVGSPDVWCAVTQNGKVFGQMFPKDVIDSIEIYYPRVDTHLVVQPMIFGVGIAPDKRATFTYMIYAGEGDAEKVREIRNALDGEFYFAYESFNKEEIPDNVKIIETIRPEAERDINVQMPKIDVQIPKIPTMPRIPNIPNIPNIPDVGAIIENVLSNVNNVIRNVSKIGTTSMMQGEQGETEGIIADTVTANKIRIRHINGDISVKGWDKPYIGHRMQGTVNQKDDTVEFTTSGELSLDVPQGVSEAELSFINGSANITGIFSRLHVSGVNGRVDVTMEKLPDDGTVHISMVTGDINLKIPVDSSCTISAATSGGEGISCDLPIREDRKIQNQLKGVLNNGTAKVLLSIVQGSISIEGL